MATEYYSPGVYVEEVDRGIKPIQGVGTAIAAFVGFTERAGPEEARDKFLRKAKMVTNWTQYNQHFGGFIENAFLPNAVYGYFLNGGGQCYVISVGIQDPKLASTAQAVLPASGEGDSLVIKARQAGPAGNQLTVAIEHDPPEPAAEPKTAGPGEGETAKGENPEPSSTFTLTLQGDGITPERYKGLTLGGGKNNVKTVINERSKLIEVEVVGKGSKPLERQPKAGTYPLSGGEFKLAPVKPPEFEGSAPRREGLGALEALEDVTMIACPDLMSSYMRGDFDLEGVRLVQQAMLAHCQRMKYCFAILDAPPGLDPQAMKDWRLQEARYDSKYGAIYYPWIRVANPLSNNGPTILIPPSGHMAGIYARGDEERGVHKAPANEVILGAVDLEVNVTKGEQDFLNPEGINCLRAFSGMGIRVWGARTLSSSDQAWRYINVRRLFNYVEASIERGTQWIVFEPNDQKLWARVRRDITAFLRRVWRSGALFGSTPEEAFYVKCDEELNPLEVREAGQLIIEIGLAPVKPAEFVIFRISQWAGPNAEAS